MGSLTEGREPNNDDPTAEPIDFGTEHNEPLAANVAPVRPPPQAVDFSRVTTRYMIAAREWTRANRDHALDALRRSVVHPWNGLFSITLWVWNGGNPRAGTLDNPGHGKEHQTTVSRYGAWLAAIRGTYPKGQGFVTSLGRSRHRGRSDDECVERSGLLLDSDDNGGWPIRELLRSTGLAFVAQMRPLKKHSHHLEIFYATPWIPQRDEDGVQTWKENVYRPAIGWIMGIFSELGGLRYEPRWDESGHATAKYAGYDSTCDQLLQANFIYTRRPGDPDGVNPVTEYAVGGALDVESLLALTGFGEVRNALERPAPNVERVRSTRLVSIKNRKVVGSKEWRNVPGLEEIYEAQQPTPTDTRISTVALLVRLRSLANPQSRQLIELCLEGRSYAPLGQRDDTMWRIANIIAALAPNEDPAQLAKLLFERSLETMAKLPDAEPARGYVKTKLALAAKKIARAQRKAGGGVR